MGLTELQLRWFAWRGYKVHKYVRVAHSWDGEVPPIFGYYTRLKLRKGLSIKTITFKKIKTVEELQNILREL